jgi:hypothetical protein
MVIGDQFEKLPHSDTLFALGLLRSKKVTTESFTGKGSLFMKRL